MILTQQLHLHQQPDPHTPPTHPPTLPLQVLIPDVQKLINQLGNVSTDLFNTRLIKPPTSVLVFPLKTRATGGALLRCTAVHDPRVCCCACVVQWKSHCWRVTPLLFPSIQTCIRGTLC